MESLRSFDGTLLAFHRVGEGPPLICVPGGPMRDAAYLGTLGGLSADHELLLLDPRGTGDSATPADPATYHCESQAADIEALRGHLGLDRIALAGHSAGAGIVVNYAAAHPEHLSHLLLIHPSPRVVGLDITNDDRLQAVRHRRDEPWFPPAFAALERLWAGQATDADWPLIAPFNYGRWDAEARTDATIEPNGEAAALYYAGTALDPAALSAVKCPVLVVTGEFDPQLPPHRAPDYAALFPDAAVAVAPAAAHSSFVDAPSWFHETAANFLY
jgi:pimeloyl-ACP methyl ester carboxylesterase